MRQVWLALAVFQGVSLGFYLGFNVGKMEGQRELDEWCRTHVVVPTINELSKLRKEWNDVVKPTTNSTGPGPGVAGK